MLAHLDLHLVGLVDVHPDEEMVERSDHHQHIVGVVEIARDDIAQNDDAVDRRDAGHLRLVDEAVNCILVGKLGGIEVLDQRVDLLFGNPEDDSF